MQKVKLISSDTTYVSERDRRKNYYFSDRLCIGDIRAVKPCPARGENEALLKFSAVSTLPPCFVILGARMYIYTDAISGERGGGAMGIYLNIEDFDGRSATWMNKPKTETAPDNIIRFTRRYVPGYVFCDITGLVLRWHTGGSANYGITLKKNRLDRNLIAASSMHSQHPPYITLEYYVNGLSPEEYLESEFTEHIFDVSGHGQEFFSPVVDAASAGTATFFIKNISDGSLSVNLQVSPNGENFIDDAQIFIVPPGDMVAATPYYFAKYYRVRLVNQNLQGNIAAKIWCQIQTKNYYMH